MGDNRADSDDSRYRTGDPGGGTIPESAVVGRAFLIIFPLSRIGDLPIPNTFQQAGLHAAAAVGTASPAAVGGAAAALSGGALVWRRRPELRPCPDCGVCGRTMGAVGRAWRKWRYAHCDERRRRGLAERNRGSADEWFGGAGGFGSPPWDPADPVPHPDLDDTQALPGLGPIPGRRARPRTGRPAPGDPRFGGGALFDGGAQGSARADETRVDLKAAVDGTDDGRAATATGPTAVSATASTAARQAPPQLLARASRPHRGRAGARAAHQVVRDPGLLHPVRLDGEHPRNRRPGADQQDRVPHPPDPPRRHRRVRRHRVVGLRHPRPARTSSARRSASSRASSASATTPTSTSSA